MCIRDSPCHPERREAKPNVVEGPCVPPHHPNPQSTINNQHSSISPSCSFVLYCSSHPQANPKTSSANPTPKRKENPPAASPATLGPTPRPCTRPAPSA